MTFTYDAAGDVLTQTDARGVTLTATYDALHRPITQDLRRHHRPGR
ncbi:MAG: RHS repeat protein [Deltaproteobacteria bacterium]|nr:RHS repeat protein [Deltaproteobacteria bacterium]